jgi:hypothetical protein
VDGRNKSGHDEQVGQPGWKQLLSCPAQTRAADRVLGLQRAGCGRRSVLVQLSKHEAANEPRPAPRRPGDPGSIDIDLSQKAVVMAKRS